MPLVLYYCRGSAPCTSVLLLAKLLKLDLQLIQLDLMKGEQLKPEFLKVNPQHVVPTLVDNGFSVWESRAILTYLFDKYANTNQESLYPKDAQLRAVINQRIYFDLGTLYQRFAEAYYPLFRGATTIDEAKVKKIEEALDFLNIFIGHNNYVAGNDFTLADIALVTTVRTIQATDFNFVKYPNIISWLERVKAALPFYEEVDAEGSILFSQFFKEALKRLK